MPRVSESELRDIIEARADEKVVQYIEDASLLINDVVGTPSSLSPARLKQLEKYLAAHFWVIAAEKGGLTSEKQGESENRYAKNEGEGLSATRFGRLVKNLDTTGALDKVLSGSVKKAILRLV